MFTSLPASLFTNYIPISIVSAFSKVIARLIILYIIVSTAVLISTWFCLQTVQRHWPDWQWPLGWHGGHFSGMCRWKSLQCEWISKFYNVPLGHCYCAQELFDCNVLKAPKQVIKIQTSDITCSQVLQWHILHILVVHTKHLVAWTFLSAPPV